MPTYEFRCPDGTLIERVFKISEVPDQIPVPNGEGMATRIISGGAALLFKGSGFYITDYGKDGKKDQRAPAGESKSEDGGSKSGDGGTKAVDGGGKPAESKSAESKSAETKSGDSKSGDSKSGDSKSGDSKSGDSKPSSSTAPSPKGE